MTAKFFALLTSQGAAALSNAAALGTQLHITQMGVGDGGGTLPTPTGTQTKLINEKRRAVLNGLSVDAANSSQIIAEQIIPENEGGFWIREIGLYDSDNTLIAVANCPETYKPMLAEGSGRTQTVRMILIINSTDAVTLKIDPSVVLATRQYVDNLVIEAKAYADDKMAKHIAASDPHEQYAPKESPKLTGKPTAPTAETATNSTQIATTEFVQVLLAALRGGAPAESDTLKKLADAVGSKLNRTDCPVGSPVPWPTATAPAGWLKCNGASFDKKQYPLLALAYPSGLIPDLRAEFIRGFDDGRGINPAQALGAWASDTLRAHNHGIRYVHSSLQSGASAVNVIDGNGTLFSSTENYGTGDETRPRSVAFNFIVRAA